MCFGIGVKEDEQVLSSSVCLYGDEKDLGVFALAQVVNDLATRGAKAVGASIHIMLPPYAYESRLKAMVEYVEEAGSAHGVQIMCAKAEVSPVISKAVVYVTVMGILKKGTLLQSSMGKPEQDIVLLKWIGLEGPFRVMREKEEELSKRFVPTFLNQIKCLEPEIFSERAISMAFEHGASAMQQITSGGILATLWEMAEASNVGMEVELKQMAIRQETVEVCEFCHLNPYQLTSAGSVLIFTERGEELVARYEELGIQATLLGRTTADSARVILGGEEKRFLDRPAPDELLKIYDNN
jgi:hydrogenase maturation factor